MRITITQDFDTVEEASEFLARVGNPAVILSLLDRAQITAESAVAFKDNTAETKTRKPRADAGKKREPYGPRAQNAEGGQAGTQPSTGAGAPAVDGSVPEKAAPSAPVSSAPAPSEQQSTASPRPSPGNTAATASVAEDFPATLDGARKAMKALSMTKGKGMEETLGALKKLGVQRISDLPPEKYGDLIKAVLSQASPEGVKAAIEWAKTAQKVK